MFIGQAGLALRPLRTPSACRSQRERFRQCWSLTARTHVPDSPEAAARQARNAMQRALAASLRQMRIELDTSLGDETFSRLKQTIPFLRLFCLAWWDIDSDETLNSSLRVLLPDEGAAAALRKDWKADDLLSNVQVLSIENRLRRKELISEALQQQITCLAVAPRATEVDALEELARAASEHNSLRLIVLNPELVDMGATGLGLAARRLRERLLNGLEPVYYLRTTPWGLVLRTYPEPWTVWIDRELHQASGQGTPPNEDASDPSEFVCIADDWDMQPSGDALTSLITPYLDIRRPAVTGPLQTLQSSWQRIQSFLQALRRT